MDRFIAITGPFYIILERTMRRDDVDLSSDTVKITTNNADMGWEIGKLISVTYCKKELENP